jgi:hypothetical protein
LREIPLEAKYQQTSKFVMRHSPYGFDIAGVAAFAGCLGKKSTSSMKEDGRTTRISPKITPHRLFLRKAF